MKSAITILLSFLLLAGQVGAVGVERSAKADGCKVCACPTQSCCKASTPSNSRPLPAAPSTSSIQVKLQWVASVHAILTQREFTAVEPQLSETVPVRSNAVPLHLRHCVFLI